MQKNKNVHTNGGTAATARKPIKIPHVYVIICAIILFVAVCTWFVPPGQFDTQTVEVEGVSRTLVIPGTFHTLEEKHPAGLVTILSSLHRGLVSGAEVTMLIFLVNGAFSMVLKTGAFNAFLGSLLRRFSSRAKLVIPVFFLTFAVLSSTFATVYKGNIIKNLIMDCQSYTKYRPNETTGGIFVSWRRKEELPTGA